VRSPGAVVIGGYVNGLGLVRALAARGVPTAVVVTKPYDIAHASRWVESFDVAYGIEERPDLLLEVLERRAVDWSGWALFPTNDEALASLARHHERLSSTFRVVAPGWSVTRSLVDKSLMLEAARSIGASVPHLYGPAVEATAAGERIQFPVVVKPVAGYRFFARFGCKLFVARDRAELRRCTARLAEAGLEAQVFDLVPGSDSRIYAYCTYVDTRGKHFDGLTVHKLRQGPPFFGVARAAELVDTDPALRELSDELLRQIGFRGGIAVTEFKLDPRDEAFRFIEVNGRSVVYNGLLRRGGLDLAGLAWSDHVLDGVRSVRPKGWPGVWVNLHADLLYSTFYRGPGRVGLADFVAPYRRPRMDAVWSVRDPGPFVAQWSGTARAGLSALRHGTHRELVSHRSYLQDRG
jgi:predicted ATP-grasp superfamily ATP-dependent carboligase